MIKNVPYLAEAAIEKDAESLLSEFSDARDVVIEAPIPIEEIIEKHLKIGIEFDDLDSRFGVEKFSIRGTQTYLVLCISTTRGSQLVSSLTQKIVRTWKAATGLPLRTRVADIGGFIGTC